MPTTDPTKARQHCRTYYAKNKNRFRERNIEQRRRRIEWLEAYKTERGCGACGERHPACLDFHHRDPTQKEGTISQGQDWGWKKLQAEVAKCEVLCSNCHRKLHWSERNQMVSVAQLASASPCEGEGASSNLVGHP